MTVDSFWERVDKSSDCWLWLGAQTTNGYGSFSLKGKPWRAHRYAYETLVGPIPKGLQIDHLCRVRLCVNPAHMEPVTQRENIMRGKSFAAENGSKTHCIHGHPFTEENTWITTEGYRSCRECRRRNYNNHYAQNREAILRRQRDRFARLEAGDE